MLVNGEARQRAAKNGALLCVTGALKKHVACEDVAVQGVSALANLCFGQHDCEAAGASVLEKSIHRSSFVGLSHPAVNLGAMELTTAAMDAHPHSAPLQQAST